MRSIRNHGCSWPKISSNSRQPWSNPDAPDNGPSGSSRVLWADSRRRAGVELIGEHARSVEAIQHGSGRPQNNPGYATNEQGAPCGLGLATPMSIRSARGGAGLGVLVKNVEALEHMETEDNQTLSTQEVAVSGDHLPVKTPIASGLHREGPDRNGPESAIGAGSAPASK
jgi:hypothetical protein